MFGGPPEEAETTWGNGHIPFRIVVTFMIELPMALRRISTPVHFIWR